MDDYTLMKGIDWQKLDGQRPLIGVSVSSITFELPDGTLVKICRAKRKARPKAKGQKEAADGSA